jgi:hypothetical protein
MMDATEVRSEESDLVLDLVLLLVLVLLLLFLSIPNENMTFISISLTYRVLTCLWNDCRRDSTLEHCGFSSVGSSLEMCCVGDVLDWRSSVVVVE